MLSQVDAPDAQLLDDQRTLPVVNAGLDFMPFSQAVTNDVSSLPICAAIWKGLVFAPASQDAASLEVAGGWKKAVGMLFATAATVPDPGSTAELI